MTCQYMQERGQNWGCLNVISGKNGNFRCNQKTCAYCAGLYKQFWVGRLAAECHTADHVRFVTLTYDDENVGEAFSLPRNHLRDYFKTRRRKYTFRHFTVGEWGDKTERPHWHSLQFYYGDPPLEPLNFSDRYFGWAKGNSQYETLRSIGGSVTYIMDYLDKGGSPVRPSPGIGKLYLLRYAKLLAEERRLLTKDQGIVYTVPGVTSRKGGSLRKLYFPASHPWAIDMAEIYESTWEALHNELPPDPLKGIPYG